VNAARLGRVTRPVHVVQGLLRHGSAATDRT
jgi:hypothetical protein